MLIQSSRNARCFPNDYNIVCQETMGCHWTRWRCYVCWIFIVRNVSRSSTELHLYLGIAFYRIWIFIRLTLLIRHPRSVKWFADLTDNLVLPLSSHFLFTFLRVPGVSDPFWSLWDQPTRRQQIVPSGLSWKGKVPIRPELFTAKRLSVFVQRMVTVSAIIADLESCRVGSSHIGRR